MLYIVFSFLPAILLLKRKEKGIWYVLARVRTGVMGDGCLQFS